jgi:outer membrane immunogenic protein
MNLNGTETLATGSGQFVPGDSFATHSHWEMSFRPRAGYTWNKLLVYATGGLAFAGVYAKSNFIATTTGGVTFPASTGSDTHTLTGGTIGGGVEYAVLKKWRVAGEYRYSGYAHASFNLGTVAVTFNNPGFTYAPARASVGLRTSEFIIKVNRKF